MDDAGVTEFAMNRLFYDMVNNPGGHAGEAGYHRRQDRFLVALEGRFLDSGQWRAYYQRGHSDVWYTRDNNLIPARFNQAIDRSEEHTSELQSLMRISYAVFCLKKNNNKNTNTNHQTH